MSFPPAWLAAAVLRARFRSILRDQRSPLAAQERAFRRLRSALAGTAIARATGLEGAGDLGALARNVPVHDYTFYQPYVARTVDGGERSVLFHGAPAYVGLSSGTTGTTNKRVVHSAATIAGFTDHETSLGAIIERHSGVNPVVSDRLVWGATPPPTTRGPHGVEIGYISNKLATNVRRLLRKRSLPSADVGRIPDMMQKIRETERELRGRDLHLASAVPTYLINLLEELRAIWGIEDFRSVWPNLSAIVYSGTPIDNYRPQFQLLLGRPVQFFGMYVSTEGPLGYEIASLNGARNGLYSFHLGDTVYTFRKPGAGGPLMTVGDLQAGDEVELLLSAPHGLVNYQLGDCLRIHSTEPLLFEVTGRTGHGLNIATEKATLSQLARAVARVSTGSPVPIRHYFVAPGQSARGRACYAWTLLVDRPDAVEAGALASALDGAMMDENIDYDDCRRQSSYLDPPTARVLDAAIARRYFERDAHRGQLKMKTAFDSPEKLEEFLRGLAVESPAGPAAR